MTIRLSITKHENDDDALDKWTKVMESLGYKLARLVDLEKQPNTAAEKTWLMEFEK